MRRCRAAFPYGSGTSLALLAVALVLAWAAPVRAEGTRPTADATFVEQAPRIDGVLDEAVWQKATPLSPMTQVEPVEGARPSRRTEVRILTDEDNLYVGVRAYDPHPDEITARSMQRDADITKEDRFGFLVDTFHDRRNGYFFETNPLGVRFDGLIEDGRFLIEWDGIWNVKTSVDSEGWQAEFVIPFKTLNFPEGQNTWGFNMLRGIRGAEENVRWSEPYLNQNPIGPGAAGTIHGLSGARQGLGLDIIPALSVARVDDSQKLENEKSKRHYTRIQPSGDIRYKITPSLTATGTANTDFGQTPVDDVQINLGPARLFFPERRDFFLQDKGIFDFGNIEVDAQPFFSRRIGLNGGDEVPIRGGGKVTGRLGPLNIGLLGVRQGRQNHDENEDDVDAKTLGVARLKLNVGEESTVGVIGTFGDPANEGGNWLVGADANYRTTELFGDKVFQAHAWYQRSHSYGPGENCERNDGRERDCDSENAFGLQFAYPNDRVNWNLVLQEIQEDFRPALGFVRRDNTRRARGTFRYRWRPDDLGNIRTIDVNALGFVLTESDRSKTITEMGFFPTLPEITTDEGDIFRTFTQVSYMNELDDRNVFDDVLIGEGEHVFATGGVFAEASRARAVSGSIQVLGGSYFGGYRVGFNGRIRWEPIRQLLFEVSYNHTRHWGLTRQTDEETQIRGGNSFNVRIATARVEVQLSPDVSWGNIVQFDNSSDSVNIQSRFRWTITPGSDLFLVLNQGFIHEHDTLKAGRTQPLVKLSWTFRF